MNVTLYRVYQSPQVVQGVLLVSGVPQVVTLERPWKNNRRNVSCIPDGEYECTLTYSQKFGLYTYGVNDVPGRSGIIFHVGNTVKDTRGCILVGSRFLNLDGLAIGESQEGFNLFIRSLVSVQTFNLEVVWSGMTGN